MSRLLALAMIILAAQVVQAQPIELFSRGVGKVYLQAEQASRYDDYRMLGSTARLKAAEVVTEPRNETALRLSLFTSHIYEARRTNLTDTAGGYTWEGRLKNDGGMVILVVHGKRITGWVWAQRGPATDAYYAISPIGGGMHVIRETRQSWFDNAWPGCGNGTPSRGGLPSTSIAEEIAENDESTIEAPATREVTASNSTCIINVLVAYTPAAQAAHGDIPALAQLATAQTNGSYTNSGITGLALNLTATTQVAYVESGTKTGGKSTDLVQLQNPSDGVMDDLHALRINAGADIVVLLVDGLNDAINIFGEASQIMADAGTAFAVVDWEAAVDNLTFAHEIGHLQGARHDNDTVTSPHEYAHGSCRTWPYNYRTIMGACGQPRVPYFSNPDVKYNNRKTGDHPYRNNARVLRETACTIGSLVGPALMGWNPQWGNGGSDMVHWWYLNADDRYVAADFDADGVAELLAVNPNGYAHLMEYAAGSWTTSWANNGSGSIDGWRIGPADVFVAGDFIPGNFRDELLGVHAWFGYAHLMTYNGDAWSTPWGNDGKGFVGSWQLSPSDRYVVGDFVAGNGRDELLAINPFSGQARLLAFSGNGWTTLWSNSGSGTIDWWLLNLPDRYLGGDFIPGNGQDELLAINPNRSSAHLMNFIGWWWITPSAIGNGAIHWWLLGGADRYIAGDFLPGTPGDEVLAIAPNNGWSQMLSFGGTGNSWQSVWGNSGAGNIGYWYINGTDSYVAGDFVAGDQRDEFLSIQPHNGWVQMHNRW